MRQITSLKGSVMGVGLVVALSFGGCDQKGIEVELHVPIEPRDTLHLEVLIDKDSDVAPKELRPGVYAIYFDKSGVAVINSLWVITRWQKTFLVTPTRRLARNNGYELSDSGLRKGKVKERLPGGGVQSYTIEDGSKYWMDLKIAEPSSKVKS